jgi:hypothetical protein
VIRGGLIAQLGCLLALAGPASAGQWSTPPAAHEVDLVVDGTMTSIRPRLVAFDGHAYEETRATIVVHQVLYRDAEAPAPGATIELYGAQHAGIAFPRLDHGSLLLRRFVWKLHRSTIDGVYTSYMGGSVEDGPLAPRAPMARLTRGTFDPASGAAELEVRYENFSRFAANVPAVDFGPDGRPRGLDQVGFEAGSGERRRSFVVRGGPASRSVHLLPWTFIRRSVRLTVPTELRGPGSLLVTYTSPGPRAWGWLHPEREEGDDDDFPELFLEPGARTRTLLAWPSPRLLSALMLLGTIPFATRRRWSRRSRRLGVAACATSLALLPWSLFGPLSAVFVHQPGALQAASLQLLLLGGLWRLLARRPLERRLVRWAAPLPALFLLGPLALSRLLP